MTLSGEDGNDVITVEGRLPVERRHAAVLPGFGHDIVRFIAYYGAPWRLRLADQEVDSVNCSGNGERLLVDVETRDPDDQLDPDCLGPDPGTHRPAAPPTGDRTPARVDFYTRRVHRRGTVIRGGLKAVCAATEAGTCSTTGSISRGAARALRIRTRSRRYTILRGATAIPAPGRNLVRLKLSRRASAALRGRRVRGLRVLLSATVRDRAGNLSVNRFTVTIRG